ncbi:hypothetical protein [Paenibacillus sp. PL91]|uniref:hypothetical protein n=1 Tax=Paenibacillus sp. PL91 TaxID=2729538 RepID=UPI00145EC819|nr:hypothetical protein [Paenibacillus sp. PL91]MBC9203741.1 hypothetical protein [Paenibacillus sp. PL91]
MSLDNLMNKMHMMDKLYIRAVMQKLGNRGYADEDAFVKSTGATIPPHIPDRLHVAKG